MSDPIGVTRDQAFAPAGALKPEVHEPLWQNLDRLAGQAGLAGSSRRYVWESVRGILDDEEMGVLSRARLLPSRGVYGVLYTPGVPQVADRFMASAGAVLRNYVNSRFATLFRVLEEQKEHGEVRGTVLFVPDFHVPLGDEVGVPGVRQQGQRTATQRKPQWVTEAVSQLLLDRMSAGLFTYLYSSDPDLLARDYGPHVAGLIAENYQIKDSVTRPVGRTV